MRTQLALLLALACHVSLIAAYMIEARLQCPQILLQGRLNVSRAGAGRQEGVFLRRPARQRQSTLLNICAPGHVAHARAQMTVTYQVGGGGHLDIDFWVCCVSQPSHLAPQLTLPQLADPSGVALTKQLKQSTGTASITADKDGRYEYCFSNEMSTIADKLVRCVCTYLLKLLQVFMLVVRSAASTYTVSSTSRTHVSLLSFLPHYLADSTTFAQPSHHWNAKSATSQLACKELKTSRSTSRSAKRPTGTPPSRPTTASSGGPSSRPWSLLASWAGKCGSFSLSSRQNV